MKNIIKMAKSLAFVLLFITTLTVNLFSQPGQGRKMSEHSEKINARRIAYITTKVGLTPKEAQEFWPVYNEFTEKRHELMHEKPFRAGLYDNIDDKSESELIKLAESEIVLAEEMAALRREYHERFMEILPPEKVVLLYIAEKDFNRVLFREMRQRGQREGRPRN